MQPTQIFNSWPFKAGVLLAALAAVAILIAVTTTDDAHAGLGRVVALGDSSASGVGLGAEYAGAPDQCDRTPYGYPALAVAQAVYSEFVNETCSGATTSSLFAGSIGVDGKWIRAQLEALNGSERIVFLGIGDNNAGFGEVTDRCLIHNGLPTNTCTDTYVQSGTNTLIARGQSIAGEVGRSIDAIRARAKNAQIFLVGYPDIAPVDAAGCAGALYLTQADAPVFDQWEQSVNATLRNVAAQHDAHFVDAYAQSAGHDACSGQQRWINPLLGAIDGVALHPNHAGAGAVSTMLVKAMLAAGVDFGPEANLSPIGFSRLHRARRGSTFSLKAPTGGGRALMLTLDRSGTVNFKLERVTTGRLAGGKCRRKTRRNAHDERCTRYASQGPWWATELPAGTSSVYVSGRAHGHALRSGRYRVRIRSDQLAVPANTTASFTITK